MQLVHQLVVTCMQFNFVPAKHIPGKKQTDWHTFSLTDGQRQTAPPVSGCRGYRVPYSLAALGDLATKTMDDAIFPKGQHMYQRYWDEFVCFAVHVVDVKASFLPASPCLVGCFCQVLGDERKAPSTIRGYLASTAGVHNSAGHPGPTSNDLTRKHINNLTHGHGTVDQRTWHCRPTDVAL